MVLWSQWEEEVWQSYLGLTERVLRSEVDFLKEQKLLYSTSSGMSLTQQGKELLQELGFVMREITGIDEMETDLARITWNQKSHYCFWKL